nr:MAG: polyprotein [Dracophyllum hypovirus]
MACCDDDSVEGSSQPRYALDFGPNGMTRSILGPVCAARCVPVDYVMKFGYQDSDCDTGVSGQSLGFHEPKPRPGRCCVGGLDDLHDTGFCYLDLIRDAYLDRVRDVVGSWPEIVELVDIPREMVDPDKLDKARAVKTASGWHFSQTGDVSVARLLQLAAARCMDWLPQDSLGFALHDLWFGDEVYSVDGPVGGEVTVDCPELESLYKCDFSACRCKVHAVPDTKCLPGAAVGCVQRPSGKAGVIANAFNGIHGMCHADESTRFQDKALLGMILSKEDPRVLDGFDRPANLAALCTSSERSDLAAFGNGYCYLSLLHHDTWWRAARLLGPNPLLRSLCRVIIWLGKAASKRHVLLRVVDGYYHVVVDKASKGVVGSAGRDICDQIMRVLLFEPNARVGGTPLPSAVEDGSVADGADGTTGSFGWVSGVGVSVPGFGSITRIGGWFCSSDDPVGERYLPDFMRHVAVDSVDVEGIAMVDLGVGAHENSRYYSSSLVRRGEVRVEFNLRAATGVAYCYYLGPGYSSVIERVMLEDGRTFEFPRAGGIAFWSLGSMRFRLQVEGLASVGCRVRKFRVSDCPVWRDLVY